MLGRGHVRQGLPVFHFLKNVKYVVGMHSIYRNIIFRHRFSFTLNILQTKFGALIISRLEEFDPPKSQSFG